MVAGTVTDQTVAWLARLERESTNPHMRVVLVAEFVDDKHVVRLVEHGVVGILRRSDVTGREIVRAVEGSGAGRADLPDDIVRALIEQVRSMRAEPGGSGPLALTARERHVVQLLAEGFGTAEIASELSYSERTIKNILRRMMTRLGLRNRAHAVAYAMRRGVVSPDDRRLP